VAHYPLSIVVHVVYLVHSAPFTVELSRARGV
jgi:hypothetical protein